MTTLSELVEQLAPGHPLRTIAAERLSRHLVETFIPSRLHRWRLSQDEVEDLAQQVLLLILTKRTDFVGKEWPYLSVVVSNRQRTLHREARRTAPGDPELLMVDVEAPGSPDPVEVAERWRLLDLALSQALTRRLRQYRAPLERSWPQLKELLEGRIEMRALILREEGLSEDVSESEFKSAQDRVYQQHKRCRVALGEAVEELAVSGALRFEDAELARRQLVGLLRVASPRQAAVRKKGR